VAANSGVIGLFSAFSMRTVYQQPAGGRVKAGIAGPVMMVTLLAVGCDAAEGVRVQELPPLERTSPEVRAGLPEVQGDWRFAGWELIASDSALLGSTLPGMGAIALDVQRLDSIAGSYVVEGTRFPVVGEVRRDGVMALVAQAGEGGRFLTGRLTNDTLWVSLTNLIEPGSWPNGARAAFVRSPVPATFARLHGQPTVLPGDTVPPVLAGPVEIPVDEPAAATGSEQATTPQQTRPAAPPQTRPAETPPAARTEQPRATPPAEQPAARPADPPAPEEPVEEPPRRAPPRLLGEPVQRDSVPA
jgi:hypothetical protein